MSEGRSGGKGRYSPVIIPMISKIITRRLLLTSMGHLQQYALTLDVQIISRHQGIQIVVQFILTVAWTAIVILMKMLHGVRPVCKKPQNRRRKRISIIAKYTEKKQLIRFME